jgi:hypothetical protein
MNINWTEFESILKESEIALSPSEEGLSYELLKLAPN